MLGGLTPQENAEQPKQYATDAVGQTVEQEERKQSASPPLTESGRNVMADVITRHEQLAARARRNK